MINGCNKKEKKCCGVSKVVIPAALGDENGEYKPQNGAYSNTLVEYQASGVSYLYSNDGIPTRMGDGIVATIEVGETTTLQPGESATVENTGDKYHAVFNFGIPKGDKGDTGATGAAATITVGSTTTGAAGTNASVTNTGTSGAAVLNFTIPRGDKGETGATGATGATGQAATIAVGSTTTLAPGSSATVTNSGTSSAATFNFGIPQGVKGDTGSVKSAYVTSLPSTGNEDTYYLNGDTATTGSVSGTAVQITNADNTGEISDFKLNGNTEQTTYTGKNLVGLAHSPASAQITEGVTISSQTDEKLVIVSSNVQYACLRLFYQLPAGTYTASTKGTSSDSYGPRITIYKAGVAIAQGVTPSSPKSFTLTEEATIDFRFFATTSEATVRTVTFYDFQLEKNNQATAYEPYVGGIASPNPDYPQAVNVVSGEQTVKVEGKNLFNQGQYNDASGNFGLSASFSPEAINLSGTSASDAWPAFTMYATGQLEASKYWPATSQIMTWRGAFNDAGNYRFTIWVDGNRGTADANFRYIIGYMDGTVENKYFPLSDQSQVWSITKPINFISVGTANNVTVNCSVRIQLEKGTSGSSFEPYQGQEFEANLGKNLFSISQDTIITNAYLNNNTALTFDSLNSVKFVATGAQGAQYLDRIISGLDSTKSYTFSFKAIKNAKGSTGLPYIQIVASGSNDGSTWTGLGFSRNDNPTEGETYSFVKTLTGYSQYRFMIFNNADTPVEIGETTTYFDMQLEEGAQTAYASYFTPIELAKIGNYQDRIYKTDGKWYIEKQVGKVVLDGTENWSLNWNSSAYIYNPIPVYGVFQENPLMLSNYYTATNYNNLANSTVEYGISFGLSSADRIAIRNKDITTVANFKTWLASHPTTIYYALATATDTAITESALITQLDNLVSAELLSGVNNIMLVPANQPDGTMSIDYTTWDKHDRYDVYIWNDTIGDYQLIHAGGGNN